MDEPFPPATPDPQRLLLARMLLFSDAVFAIVLTLLALDLRMPTGFDDAHLYQGLIAMKGELIAFAVSFAIVAVFWIAHLTVLRSLARFDWGVAIANLVFLFTVTVTPFTTTLVGDDGTMGNGWRLYCVSIIAISLAQVVLLLVSHRDETRLLLDAHHGRLWVRILRACAPGLAFAVGLILSLVGQHFLASLCWVLTPLPILAGRWLEPRRVRVELPTTSATKPEATA